MDAAELAMSSVHDDLLHRRNKSVEVKMLNITVVELDTSSIEISLELGVTDDSSTLQSEITFVIWLNFAVHSKQGLDNVRFFLGHSATLEISTTGRMLFLIARRDRLEFCESYRNLQYICRASE